MLGVHALQEQVGSLLSSRSFVARAQPGESSFRLLGMSPLV